jgi:hypothetical protein
VLPKHLGMLGMMQNFSLHFLTIYSPNKGSCSRDKWLVNLKFMGKRDSQRPTLYQKVV